MKIPLIAKSIDNGLSIVYNSERKLVEFPFRPYVWSREISANNFTDKEGPIECTDLWTKKPITLYKVFFDTPSDAYNFYRDNDKTQNVFTEFYDQLLLIEQEDFYLQFPNTNPLKILIIDIEVSTDGSGIFPTPINDPILLIGAKYICGNEKEIVIFDNYNESEKDKTILNNFLDYFRDKDPDLVVGYNHIDFDLPYIINRVQKFNIMDIRGKPKLTYLTRYGVLPFGQVKEGEKPQIMLHGRVMFDILKAVREDQTLFGIKDNKMKTLAKWYKIPYTDLDVSNTLSLIYTQEFKNYLINDLDVTEKLMNIYFPLYQDLAELLHIPLDNVVNGSPSFLPKIVIARDLHKNKIIPFQNNETRYPGKVWFQAAMVDLLKSGYHKNVSKIDFSGFYPSLITTFNLGSDTTQLCSFLPYTGKYNVRMVHNTLWINIPDSNINKNILIKIDQSRNSFLRQSMDKLFKIRKEAKEKIKMNENVDFWKVRSSTIKIIMNSIFGNMGLKFSMWGDMATAIAIVGLARWILMHVIDVLGDSVISFDTDGIFVDVKPNVDKINNDVINFIKKHTQFSSDRISIFMEDEFDGSGYFYKQKNYILKKENGKLEKHGVAIKSSRQSKVSDKVIDKIASGVLDEKDSKYMSMLIRGVRDLDNYKINDFIMRTKINKALDDYTNPNCLQCKLARQAKEIFNRDIQIGNSLSYIRTFDGYKLSGAVKGTHEVDKKYYGNIIEKALYIFNYGAYKDKENKKKREKEIEESQIKLDFFKNLVPNLETK